MDGDPPYWRILGRTSVDIIKSAGYKISALGIENVLLAHPAVAECAVVGLPDDALGERVAAVVACKDAPVSAPLPPGAGASARRPARPPGEDMRGATWRLCPSRFRAAAMHRPHEQQMASLTACMMFKPNPNSNLTRSLPRWAWRSCSALRRASCRRTSCQSSCAWSTRCRATPWAR